MNDAFRGLLSRHKEWSQDEQSVAMQAWDACSFYMYDRASKSVESPGTVPGVPAANSQSVAALVEIVTTELAFCGIITPEGFKDHITDKFNQRLNAEAALHT